jgi:hypothetical protein
MEMFLLFGDNYLDDKTIGEECHKKRMSFEMNLPPSVRRIIYRHLADIGIGRNCIVIAGKK